MFNSTILKLSSANYVTLGQMIMFCDLYFAKSYISLYWPPICLSFLEVIPPLEAFQFFRRLCHCTRGFGKVWQYFH